jgi:hypothetical protein
MFQIIGISLFVHRHSQDQKPESEEAIVFHYGLWTLTS